MEATQLLHGLHKDSCLLVCTLLRGGYRPKAIIKIPKQQWVLVVQQVLLPLAARCPQALSLVAEEQQLPALRQQLQAATESQPPANKQQLLMDVRSSVQQLKAAQLAAAAEAAGSCRTAREWETLTPWVEAPICVQQAQQGSHLAMAGLWTECVVPSSLPSSWAAPAAASSSSSRHGGSIVVRGPSATAPYPRFHLQL
jgi:hypothetical protein